MLADTRKQFAHDAEAWWIHATNFINATVRLFDRDAGGFRNGRRGIAGDCVSGLVCFLRQCPQIL
jgi:hypothetical protein